MTRSQPAFGMLLALLALAPPARGEMVQLALDPEVHSIRYRFEGPHVFDSRDLGPMVSTTAPGRFHSLASLVGKLPFVPSPARRPFSPIHLQHDVVRLRHFYAREGFPRAAVNYHVETTRDARQVKIEFRLAEGPPILVSDLSVVAPDSTISSIVSAGLEKHWSEHLALMRKFAKGSRLSVGEIERNQGMVAGWLADHGYLHAVVTPQATIDTARYVASVVLRVDARARVKVGRIVIRGVESVPERVVHQAMSIREGDWASTSRTAGARQDLQSVDLFRRANVSMQADSGADNVIPLDIQITEGRSGLANAELGYVTDGAGVTGQMRWTHPNFTGGARSLNLVGLVQTGWGTTAEVPDRLYRASVTLRQPSSGAPRLSLSVGPAYEYRDDKTDLSVACSGIASLLYRINALQSASLGYSYTYRRLEEYRIASVVVEETADWLGFGQDASRLLDSLKVPTRTSEFGLSASLGGFDDIARPRIGLVLKPLLAVTALPTWGNVEFARADLQATLFVPVPGRGNALMLRATSGRLWPFGESVPAAGEVAAADWLRLTDQLFTAGGASDVRGYENEMLGPKFPRVEIRFEDGDTLVSSDRYIAVGGLARTAFTGELRLGIVPLGRNVFAHLFADAGHVWIPDSRFRLEVARSDDMRTLWTTGGGLGYYTPVGAIRLDLGYKLNPSALDLRHPNDVLTVIQAGQPVESAPVDHRLRYRFHFSLGLYF